MLPPHLILRRIRINNRYLQRTVASSLNISLSKYKSYEQGKVLTTEELINWMKQLDMTEEEIKYILQYRERYNIFNRIKGVPDDAVKILADAIYFKLPVTKKLNSIIPEILNKLTVQPRRIENAIEDAKDDIKQ